MKKVRLFIFFIVFILSLLITYSSFATSRSIRVISKQGEDPYLYKDYHAIVIGISDYEKWPKLPNAANDAKEVAIKFKQIGFDVQLVINLTSSELKYIFSDIARRLGTEKNRALMNLRGPDGPAHLMISIMSEQFVRLNNNSVLVVPTYL